MMDEFSANEFRQGFLEEAGEHIQSIHQNLLRLDELLTGGEEDTGAEQTQIINELFRSFHTIKGLAGMVGLAEASQVSHAMETVLQAARSGKVQVEPRLTDQLLEGTRVLQAVVNTLNKAGQAMPETGAVIEQLQRLLEPPVAEETSPVAAAPEPPAAPAGVGAEGSIERDLLAVLPDLKAYPEILKTLGKIELQKIRRLAQAGQLFSLAFFTPSLEKSARGENVDFVRSRLNELGAVIKAVPLMQSGSIHFTFLAAADHIIDAAAVPLDEVIPLAIQPPAAARQRPVSGAQPGPAREVSRSTVVRVELDRLDELVRYAGDLVILRARLGESLAQLNGAPVQVKRELNQTYQQLGRTLRDLRRAILRARMVPLAEVFNHMPLVVRDVARSTGKSARLKVEGENAEVDKMLVERLLDPLIHLLRNAVIHGIEPPDERVAAGKPAQGNLLLRGVPEGDHILITVADDGRGVDLARVQEKAELLGWVEQEHPLTRADALELLTRSGFTTRDQADLSAGRGMGLDIVSKMVRSVGGSLALETTPGQGTTFVIRLPLTLMIMDALVVQVGTEWYAVPRDMVDEVIEIYPQDLVTLESGEMLHFRGAAVVLHSLARLIDLPPASQPEPPPRCRYGLLRRSAVHHEALVVDRVISLREVVVHTLTEPLIARPGIGGATELGDGRVILILDLPVLFRLGK